MSGRYVIWGQDSTKVELQNWANREHLQLQFIPNNAYSIDLTRIALIKPLLLVPMAALVMGMLVVLLGISAQQAEANTQKLLNGVRSMRIAGENALRSTVEVLFVALVGTVVALLVVTVRSGASYIPPYLLGIGHLLVPFVFVTVLLSLTVSIFTWPNVVSIAKRRNPIRHVTGMAEVSKVISFAAAIMLAPFATSGVLSALASVDEGSIWLRFGDAVSVNSFGSLPGTAEDQQIGERYRQAVDRADQSGTVQVVYDLSARTETPLTTAYGGVVLVNRHYLETVSAANSSSLDELVAPLSDREISSLDMTVTETVKLQLSEELREDPLSDHFVVARWRGGPFPIISSEYLQALRFVANPLLFVVDSLGTALSGNFLQGASSSAGVLFDSDAALRSALRNVGLLDRAQSIDSVADQGLIDLQDRQQLLLSTVLGFALLAVAAFECIWVSARVYVRSRTHEFLPFALGGVAFTRTLRGRLTWETGLIAALTCISALIAALSHIDGWAVMGVSLLGVACICMSLFWHKSEYRMLIENLLWRRL